MSAGAVNEEVQKKNTDCVYFLASPLTCKKGNDCEFRHSESARNNPRDCWYWLSGACLNPHCAFRHPPLEGLPEGDTAGTSVPLAGKSRVPCYYFMQGYCAKGDRCIFMHGLPTAGPAAEASQKLPKPSVEKATDMLDNQVSAIKGNGSVISGASFEPHEAPANLGFKPNQEVEATMYNMLPEGSDSSAPARPLPRQSDNLKEVFASNGRVEQGQAPENRLLHQEAQTEEETLCAYQAEDVRVGEDHSGEDHARDGTESEELWEESSFDVLVDDGGNDQFIYADELEHCDGLVGQLRGHLQAGILGAEGFVDFDYDHHGAYSEYYDASAEYELATYDAYEQQLLYERLNSYDHTDGIQPIVGSYKNRHRQGMLPRNSRDMPCDGEASRSPAVNSNDLRNHIVKRRRVEKSQKFGDDYQRRHQGNGFQHNGRHQEGYSRQQDVPGRHHGSPLMTARSKRQLQGRGESAVARHFHGRLGEQATGAKSAYRDNTSDQEDTSERGSAKRFRGFNETFRAKVKRERVRPRVSEVDEVLGSRGLMSQHKKRAGEAIKEDFSFAGPKTLAQIKAEKMKAMGGGSSGQDQESTREIGSGSNDTMRRQNSLVRNRFSLLQGSVDELLSTKELDRTLRHAKQTKAEFEGPKSLSVILKEKRGEGGHRAAKEEGQQECLGGDTERRSSLSDIRKDSSTYTELQSANPVSWEANKRTAKGAFEHGNSVPSFLSNNKGEREGVRLDKDVDDPEFDPEDGVDMGNSVMEDAEFEDDDEDDFVRKLGGF